MAILGVKEQFDRRSGRARIDRGREYVRGFIVETDSITVGPFEVLTARDPTSGTMIPQPGDRHPEDGFALAQDVTPTQMSGSDRIYDVVVSYSTIVPKTQEAAIPLDRFAKYSWGFLSTTAPYAYDARGKPSENTAGVPYDPPLVRTQSIPVLSVRWNTPDYNITTVAERMDTINADAFAVVGYNIDVGECKLVQWNAEALSEAGYFFFANSVVLQFRQVDPGWPAEAGGETPLPWDHVISQYGFSQIVQNSGTGERNREAIMISGPPPNQMDLIQTPEPLPLDDDGVWIQDPTIAAAAKVHQPGRFTNFAALGLPP